MAACAKFAHRERVDCAAAVELKWSRIGRAEMLGMASGVLLILSTLLPWFVPNVANEHSNIKGEQDPATPWEAYPTLLVVVLVLCALAPFVLSWIRMRGHEVGWLPGEMTAIVGFIAMMLVLLNGLVLGQPGTVEVSLTPFYVLPIIASIGILISGALRQYTFQKPEPPGV
jgi:hypothetical protein